MKPDCDTPPARPDFDAAAAAWDERPGRVELSHRVAETVTRIARPDRRMRVLDYGCATGLVASLLQESVGEIVAADAAEGMLQKARQRLAAGTSKFDVLRVDLEREAPDCGVFDLIYSSMTLHHVENTALAACRLAGLLAPGGRLCIIDLDAEDGSFHRGGEYVPHRGFAREAVRGILEDAGLLELRVETAFIMEREIETGERRSFSLFAAHGRKGPLAE